ncbi:MAG: TetR family transcriptional regulator [Microthrixaceae bacterium]
MSQSVAPARAGRQSLRARKRDETRARIAGAAVELVSAQGIPATTVEQVAERAGVGRATFFRYFESKELAIAAGLSDVAVYVFASTLRELPDELGPLDAVREAHRVLADGFDELREMYLEQAMLSRASAAMTAWTLYLYVDWEIAIADAVRPRFADLVEDDPRPRMVGAVAMAAARLAVDRWVATGGRGDLPELLRLHLASLDVGPALVRS